MPEYNGYEIIQSATLFETGAAALIAAEGKLLQKLVERKESESNLIRANNQISDIVCCLKALEEEIVGEILSI